MTAHFIIALTICLSPGHKALAQQDHPYTEAELLDDGVREPGDDTEFQLQMLKDLLVLLQH